MNYTVHYRLIIRGVLTEDDMTVKNAPTKYHAIEYVRYILNIDCMQTFENVYLDCQVVGESKDPLTILLKEKKEQ